MQVIDVALAEAEGVVAPAMTPDMWDACSAFVSGRYAHTSAVRGLCVPQERRTSVDFKCVPRRQRSARIARPVRRAGGAGIGGTFPAALDARTRACRRSSAPTHPVRRRLCRWRNLPRAGSPPRRRIGLRARLHVSDAGQAHKPLCSQRHSASGVELCARCTSTHASSGDRRVSAYLHDVISEKVSDRSARSDCIVAASCASCHAASTACQPVWKNDGSAAASAGSGSAARPSLYQWMSSARCGRIGAMIDVVVARISLRTPIAVRRGSGLPAYSTSFTALRYSDDRVVFTNSFTRRVTVVSAAFSLTHPA